MIMKGLKKAVSALMAVFMLTANIYASTGFTEDYDYVGIGKITMDMTISEDELKDARAEAKKELAFLGADSAYNLSLIDLATSKSAIYTIVDEAADSIGAEIITLPYNNTYSLASAEILYEGVSDDGKLLSDASVVNYESSVITADGLGRAIVKAGEDKYLIKTNKAAIALVLVSGQSNAAGAESDASLAPSALGKYKGRYFITNSMNQAVSLSDITWDEARYEAEHGGAPSTSVAKGGWVGTARGAGTASSLGKRLSDEWDMAVWVVNTGFGGHPMEGFDPAKTTHSDYTNTVNIVKKVKEVIGSDRHYVLDNSKTGLFWIQGCSDGIGTESENTMAEYTQMFMNMYSGFKNDIGINYAGIWLVRAGTYNNGDKDFYMSGPRLSQIYMANSKAESYKNIHLVFNPDIWRTDAGVKAHFEERYPDADAFKSSYGYDRPTTVNEVKPDIHYRQSGYNELGDIAGEVMADILSGNAATPMGTELLGYDGNKISDTGFELMEGETLLAVPFATSHYYNASFSLNVTVASTNVATFDNATFTLKGVSEGETTVNIYLGETLLKSYPVKVTAEEVEQDAVCYIGEDEETGVYYDTFMDAVKATNHTSVKTIHLLKDAIWEDYTYENGYGAHHRKFVLEGHGYTLKLNQQMHISLNSDVTFNDVIVDLNTSYNILLGAGGKLTLGDKTVVKNANSDFYAIGLENRMGDGGSLTLLPGSKITGNKSNVLGIIYGGCAGTIKVEGEITGNTASNGAIRINNSNVKVIVGKSANVTGNTSKNIALTGANQLTIAADFNGEAGISFGGDGSDFATVEVGAELNGITNDSDAELEAKVISGKAIWKVKGAEATGKCYIGSDTENMLSLHEAINLAPSGSTIYVTDNITWDNVTTYWNKNVTITSVGDKKTITMPATSNLRITGESGNITFENITLDFNFNGKMLAIDDGATVKLKGADLLNGKGGVGGTVQLGGGTKGHLVMDANSTISGRATENAPVGAVIHLHGGNGISTFTMNGGKIINYDASGTHYAVACWNSNSTVTIGGNATIVNGESSEATPSVGRADAISVKNASQLILKGKFEGSIKVNCAAAGNVFGIAEDGAEIAGSLTKYNSETTAYIDSGKLIWLTDGDCYIGDADYDKITLKEAIEKAPSGSVIHLVRDVTLNETIMLNRIGVSLTLDGTNGDGMYKIEFPIGAEEELSSANKRVFHIRNGHLTLNNVILKGGMHKDYGGSVIVEEASCSLTLTGKTEIRGARATNGGAVWVRKGTLTIKDDALITENTAQIHGGAIYLTDVGGKVNLEGGKITGNFGPGGGGLYAGAGTNIYFKNDAYVYGNIANRETNAESNIIPENAETIVLNDSFTGKAGISYGNLKEVFGEKTGGDGEYNLVSDKNSAYYGYAEDGKLIWIPGQLKLSTDADAGTKADGKATIRFITKFDKADNLNALSYGTYIIPKSLFADFEKDVYGSTEEALKAYFVSAKKGDATYKAPSTGESFGVDYVEIPATAFDMEFVAVSFINLDGTYIYIRHSDVSVEGFGEDLKTLE